MPADNDIFDIQTDRRPDPKDQKRIKRNKSSSFSGDSENTIKLRIKGGKKEESENSEMSNNRSIN